MSKRPPSIEPKTAAHAARLIARGALKGAFATNRRAARPSQQHHPYVSKVGMALDLDGAPLFLFSTLSAHTQDVLADARASILLEAPADAANPLEDARCTLSGTVRKLDGTAADAARTLYLARHPGAAMYAGFGDFNFWRMDVGRVHYVGGFGAAKWAKASDYLTPAPDLVAAHDRLLVALNGEKQDMVRAVFKTVLGKSGRGWSVVGLDPDGLSLAGPKSAQARLDFSSPAKDARAWQARLRAMAKRAGC